MGCGASAPPPTVATVDSVAVIGGGIAGVTAAYYLAKKGLKVTIFEKESGVGQMTSYGPAGVTMWKNVKKAFDFDGTVSLADGGVEGSARLAEGSAWMIFGNDPERGDMMLQARLTFEKFLGLNPDAKVSCDDGGLLYMLDEKYYAKNLELFKDDPTFVFYSKAEFEKSDIYDKIFDGAEYYGIIHSKEECYVDPARMTKFIAKAVVSMGGDLSVSSEVTSITERGGCVSLRLKDNAAEVEFGACVVALGAFPGPLLKASGLDDGVDEIYGLKGYSITGRMPEGCLRRGVVDCMDVKFFRPYVDAKGNFCVRAGGCADAYDDEDPLRVVDSRMGEFKKNQLANKLFEHGVINEGAKDTKHDLIIEENKIEVWTGIRPVNKNGRVPLVRWAKGSAIDRAGLSDSERIAVVSGFGSNGFVMCWHAGPQLAEMFEKAPVKLMPDAEVLARSAMTWEEYYAKHPKGSKQTVT